MLRTVIGVRLDLITLIVGAVVTLYALALLLQPEAILQPSSLLSFLSPGSRALWQLGMTGSFAWELGWWWTSLTAIYLHGGLLHIAFNVMWIRNLGPVAADAYGPARTFVLFNVSGVAGFLLSNVMSGVPLLSNVMSGAPLLSNAMGPVPTIGASGAIFGLLAALIVYGQKRGGSMMTQQLWQWAIVLFVFGFLMPGINNWAHGGGFVGGWVTAHLMGFSDEQNESNGMLVAALALVLLTVVGFGLSFVKVTEILLAG